MRPGCEIPCKASPAFLPSRLMAISPREIPGRTACISRYAWWRDAWRRARVRAAFRAAAERPAKPFVRTALRAAAERSEVVRRAAARFAWPDKAARDAVLRGSCLSTRDTALETRGRRWVLRLCWPAS